MKTRIVKFFYCIENLQSDDRHATVYIFMRRDFEQCDGLQTAQGEE